MPCSRIVVFLHLFLPNTSRFHSLTHPRWQCTLDKNGLTPLHRAAAKGMTAMVEALLDCGADPSLQGKLGSTPLDMAMDNNHTETASALADALEDWYI